jgi:hypothetical protein
MLKFPICLALCFIAGMAMATTPVPFHEGSGPPNVVPSGRDVCWSEPADLNGLIGSSEQILSLGLETELANDFVPNAGCVQHVTWWGGYYNNSTPCVSGTATPGFNLKFYTDAGCVPAGAPTAVVVVTGGLFTETSVGCQLGVFPMFKWDADVGVAVTAGNLYWFGAQMIDHAYPPQAGRLAAAVVTYCDTVFQSAYFGFPDWTPAVDVFGVAFDCSQEFTCLDAGCIGPPPPDYPGACCFGGDCRILYGEECYTQGGQWQGDNTVCDPNPCTTVPTKSTTWGKIKGSYR